MGTNRLTFVMNLFSEIYTSIDTEIYDDGPKCRRNCVKCEYSRDVKRQKKFNVLIQHSKHLRTLSFISTLNIFHIFF